MSIKYLKTINRKDRKIIWESFRNTIKKYGDIPIINLGCMIYLGDPDDLKGKRKSKGHVV